MAEGKFGGIAESDLAAFMASNPAFSDAGVGLTARFARSAAKLIFTREAKTEPKGLSAIVLSESLRADTEHLSATTSLLVANGNDAIVGRVWLVQAELRSGAHLKLDPLDPSKIRSVLENAGLGGRPTILVDARAKPWQSRLYPLGVENEEAWVVMDISDSPISESALKETLDRFWTQCLRTPTLANQTMQKIWRTPSKGVPMPRPEQRVQSRLHDALVGAFPRRKIRAEVRTDEGRGDIFIMGDTTSTAGTPARSTDWVLELKALCDMASSGAAVADAEGKTKEAISKGVTQALAYRTDQNGVQAALCCYEMRKSNEDDASCFAHVAANASANEVRLWRWTLFRGDNDARIAKYAATASA